jgi:hypothetical protein
MLISRQHMRRLYNHRRLNDTRFPPLNNSGDFLVVSLILPAYMWMKDAIAHFSISRSGVKLLMGETVDRPKKDGRFTRCCGGRSSVSC